MDTYKVIFTIRAREDLRSIVTYICGKSSGEIGGRVGSALIEKALSLSRLPERGRILPELKNPAVREIFFKTYRIVFLLRTESVHVVRFWHAARGTPEIDSDEFGSV